MNRTIITFLTSCLILALSNTAVSIQPITPTPVSKNFTVDNGLPSNEVYHVIQDSLGFIWLATANGVSRFDGSTFTNFGLDDGLVEGTIHEIYIDYSGRLWFISNSGKIVYFENDTIKAFPYNHKINDFIPRSRGPLKKSFHVDKNDNVNLTLKNIGRIEISPEGIFTQPYGKDTEPDIIIEPTNFEEFLVSFNIRRNYNATLLLNNEKINIDIQKILGVKFSTFHFFFLKQSMNSYIMTIGGSIIHIEKGKVKRHKKFGHEIIWANFDKKGNLWVAPIEGGVYFFKNGDFTNENSLYLFKNTLITSVIMDKEEGYWFTSLTNGFYYCPNINFLTYSQENGLPDTRVNTVFANRNGIYLGYNQGLVSKINNNLITNYIIDSEKSSSSFIRYIGIDSTSTDLWIASSNHIFTLKNNKVLALEFEIAKTATYPRQIIESDDGQYWIASSWGIRKFDGNKITYNSRLNDEFSGQVNTVYQDSTGALWMGATNGLWKYQNNTYSYLGDQSPLFSHATKHIIGNNDGIIYVATSGIGLVVICKGEIFRITQREGLASNYINKIVINDNEIWLATSNGISRIKGDISSNFTVQNITTSNGLPTNEVTSLFVRGEKVYAATSKGLTIFSKNLSLKNSTKSTTKISSVKASGIMIDLATNNKPATLSYNQNYITINYIGLAYKNMGNVQYRYRLLGLDSTWIYTKSTSAIFSGIQHGKYSFQVQSQNSDNIWGSSANFDFRIRPPYWKASWFIVASAIFFSVILFSVYRLRIKAIRTRNKLLNNINIYKQQSLRQQMNPHFIFNTLNSIQLYILEKDHISSHKYLTKFAKLMRMVLDNSQKPTILLKDELEALKLYLELESIRLAGKFEYFIEVDDNDSLRYRIPTLLIQPFVENSIWHGIMLKPEKDGWVRVCIKSSNGVVICTIEDNGVGRKAAQAIRNKQDIERKSLGFKITAQRIELLNTFYKNQFEIKYIDLYENEIPTGTRVEIKIPYTKTYDSFTD